VPQPNFEFVPAALRKSDPRPIFISPLPSPWAVVTVSTMAMMHCGLSDADRNNPKNNPDAKSNNNPNHESVTDFLVKRSGHAPGAQVETPPHLKRNWPFALGDAGIDWGSASQNNWPTRTSTLDDEVHIPYHIRSAPRRHWSH
jgi:hypothetical protein